MPSTGRRATESAKRSVSSFLLLGTYEKQLAKKKPRAFRSDKDGAEAIWLIRESARAERLARVSGFPH